MDRGTLFIADDDGVPEIHDHGVMLQTAESIRDSRRNLLPSDDGMADSDGNGADSAHHEAAEIEPAMNSVSILQWNVFGTFGRFWSRYPLMATTVNDLEPDIVCLQSAVAVKWWQFGTLVDLHLISRRTINTEIACI